MGSRRKMPTLAVLSLAVRRLSFANRSVVAAAVDRTQVPCCCRAADPPLLRGNSFRWWCFTVELSRFGCGSGGAGCVCGLAGFWCGGLGWWCCYAASSSRMVRRW